MPDLQQWLRTQYQRLPNHNYGWWLTTREHQDVTTLVTTVQFLYGRFGGQPVTLSNADYTDLQRALGRPIPSAGAKSVLNRHLLLNMWRPLRLLERAQPAYINPFQLSDQGQELAQAPEPRRILENILQGIRFVHPDWTRPTVAASYRGITVQPYQVLSDILENINGYLTREEYRLFISRMKSSNRNTIGEATQLIQTFRELSSDERNRLLKLEPTIFPSNKTYHNWVDMDLHTFSLFALGTRFRRNETILVLAGTSVDTTVANAFVLPEGSSRMEAGVPTHLRRPRRRQLTLRIPAPDPSLDLPPAPTIEANSGQEAEGLIKRILEGNGFEVRDFSRFRGYGFDLWARHKQSHNVYYCEVKSSTGTLSNIEFTRLEIEAAHKYLDRYLVFCVEQFDYSQSTGDVWTIQNPSRDLPSILQPKTVVSYSAPRSEWQLAAKRFQ